MATETTLILFKPDAVQKNLVGAVLARYQAEGFTIRGIKMMSLSDELPRCVTSATLPMAPKQLKPSSSVSSTKANSSISRSPANAKHLLKKVAPRGGLFRCGIPRGNDQAGAQPRPIPPRLPPIPPDDRDNTRR